MDSVEIFVTTYILFILAPIVAIFFGAPIWLMAISGWMIVAGLGSWGLGYLVEHNQS